MARIRILIAAAALLICHESAAAQTRSTLSLMPPNADRWDLAGYVGWVGNRSSNSSYPSGPRDWYEVGSGVLSAGYYWSPNLKLELDIGRSSEGEGFSYETFPVPGESFPFYRSRRLRFYNMTTSGNVVYQFFENHWFHPFVGAGYELLRVRQHAEMSQQGPLGRPSTPIVVPLSPSTTITYTARPILTGGFKAYVAEHAFFRTDLRVGISDRTESIVWRVGAGFDF